MSGWLERIRNGEVLLADGAMGTMLMEQGLPAGACPELFGYQHPEILQTITRTYLAAGADIVQTNTFGASPLKLEAYGLAARTEELNRTAVDAVRQAIARQTDKHPVYVIASCGPSGRLLKPYGATEPEIVQNSFERQVSALNAAGIDGICFETMMDLTELLLAVKAAKTVAPELPVIASVTYEARRNQPDSFVTMMGNSLPDVVRALEAAGADVIGANCGQGMEMMILIAQQLRRATQLPVSIRPNAGLPQTAGDRTVYPETPEFMASRLPELLAAGVTIIGGCCGTTPDHIRAFRPIIDGFNRRQ